MTITKYKIDKTWQDEHEKDIHFEGVIELDDRVTASVNENWRAFFYNLTTTQEIAEHIAYNMVVNDATLSRLDGFANLPDDYAVLKI